MRSPMELESELKELQRQLAHVDLLTSKTNRGDKGGLELLLLKKGKLKFKIYQEPGHRLPHIHIGYGQKNHAASYTIDPAARLVGTLDRKYDRTVTDWISIRKEKLLNIWLAVQAGIEVSNLVIELAGDA